jgi:hypothetical protein
VGGDGCLDLRTALGDILKCYFGARGLRPWLVVVTSCAFFLTCSDPLKPGMRAAQAEVTPPQTVNDCLGFTTESGDKLLVIRATNACERRLECQLDYVVRCYDKIEPRSKPTAQAKQQRPFRVAAKASAELLLSAESCKRGWSIDEVSWACR